MQAIGEWKGGRQTVLKDGRGHEVRVDLPREEHGQDSGTSALELAVLSLAGCISTIFAVVAQRRRVPFQALRVELTGERPRGAATVARVVGRVVVASDRPYEEVDQALAITLRTCPVGVLFERAQVPVEVTLLLEPSPSSPLVATAPGLGVAGHGD
jgi:putative redox protein